MNTKKQYVSPLSEVISPSFICQAEHQEGTGGLANHSGGGYHFGDQPVPGGGAEGKGDDWDSHDGLEAGWEWTQPQPKRWLEDK